MKTFQRLFATGLLAFTFTIPTFAGEMDCPVAAPPPPTSPTTQGDMHTGSGATTEGEAWSGVVWDVVEGVLALL